LTEPAVKKPFYLRPPINILFDINRLEKLTPWNVNIAFLLRQFLSEMERMGKVDFRASGVALDSSALIYLMKSKLLLTLQEPPASGLLAGCFPTFRFPTVM
jgi:chromatin segregation and condensation protein Rec8/ScpA/Scc1 (kleisin family)